MVGLASVSWMVGNEKREREEERQVAINDVHGIKLR
jgi:hypothetical protein